MSGEMDTRPPRAQQERERRGDCLQRRGSGSLMRLLVSHESLLRYEDNAVDGNGGLDSLAPYIQSLMPGSPIIIQTGGHATYAPILNSQFQLPGIWRPRIKNLRDAISAANLHNIPEGHAENQYQEGINNAEEQNGDDDNESINNATEAEDGVKNVDEQAKNAGGGGGGGTDDTGGNEEKGEEDNPAGKRTRPLDSCFLNDTIMEGSTRDECSFHGKCIHKRMDLYCSFIVRETGMLSRRFNNYAAENLGGMSTGSSTTYSRFECHAEIPIQGIMLKNFGIWEIKFCFVSHGRMCRIIPLFPISKRSQKESTTKEVKEDISLNAQGLSREVSEALIEVRGYQDDDTEHQYSDWICACMEEDGHESSLPAEEKNIVESEPSAKDTTPTQEEVNAVSSVVVEESKSTKMTSKSLLAILTGSAVSILFWSCMKKHGSRKKNPRSFQSDEVVASKSNGKISPSSCRLRSPVTSLGSFNEFEDLLVDSEVEDGANGKNEHALVSTPTPSVQSKISPHDPPSETVSQVASKYPNLTGRRVGLKRTLNILRICCLPPGWDQDMVQNAFSVYGDILVLTANTRTCEAAIIYSDAGSVERALQHPSKTLEEGFVSYDRHNDVGMPYDKDRAFYVTNVSSLPPKVLLDYFDGHYGIVEKGPWNWHPQRHEWMNDKAMFIITNREDTNQLCSLPFVCINHKRVVCNKVELV